MKRYLIIRNRTRGGRVSCAVLDDGARTRHLRHRRRGHSPTGFEFGYEGSGPAELARAIVRDVTGDQTPHPRLYQHVKRALIAPLAGDGPHVLSEADVHAIIDPIAEREN